MRRLPALFLALLAAVPLFAQVRESITVERILLDVRVTDFDGDAIAGLGPADFDVRIGGKRAEVLSATWVNESSVLRADHIDKLLEGDATLDEIATAPADEPPQGRLFVFFIQTDFGRNTERIRGQMHFTRYADQLLEMLEPGDRVAVFSFDSHLKFRLDFTSDKEQITAAMRGSMAIDRPEWPPVVPNPAMGSRLNREELKNARDSEAGLIIVGNALRHIPGPKTLMLMGWGLGELTASGGVRMKHRYPAARRTLEAARVTVFALDTTYADYHSLEVGLGKAAGDTGGFYAKTHLFPMQSIDRLRRTLAGHYELELRRPDGLKSGTHEVLVQVKRREVYILAPSSWMDR